MMKKYIKALNAAILLIICGWLAFMYPSLVLLTGIFIPVVGYFVVLVGFSSIGKISLGEQTQASSRIFWLLQLLIGQIALLILTWAAAAAFLGGGPPYANQMITVEDLSSIILNYRAWWGIFPWGLFALWGLIIAYTVYVKKWLPYLYQVAQDFCPRRFQAFFKASIETATSSSSILSIALCVCSVVLLVTYGLQHFIKTTHFEVPVVTVLFFSAVMMLFAFRPFVKKIQKITNRYGLGVLLTVFILICVVTLVSASFGNAWFIVKNPELYKTAQCPQCLDYFRNVPHQTRFAVLYWGWWIIWTPFAGTYLAKISQGRTIREFMLGVFLVPLLLLLLYLSLGSAPFIWALEKLVTVSTWPMLFVLAGASWLIMIKLTGKQSNTNFFITGLLESPESREDRLRLSTGSKKMALSRFATRLLMMILGTLFLHSVIGWYGIQIQAGATALHMVCTVYLGGLFIIARFLKDKAWELPKSVKGPISVGGRRHD